MTQDAAANPTTCGLPHVTDALFGLSAPWNPLHRALTCHAVSLEPGDIGRHAYADGMHPTPYFHNVLTQRVAQAFGKKGLL